jgi:hypothetical protein
MQRLHDAFLRGHHCAHLGLIQQERAIHTTAQDRATLLLDVSDGPTRNVRLVFEA